MSRKKVFSISLFWRIFFLLAGLLAACTAAWVQIAIAIESEPRAQQSAQQISSLINLSRAALVHADPIYRLALIKSMAKQEGVRIWPREMGDVVAPEHANSVAPRLHLALLEKLGGSTVVTSSVNGEPGLWVSFEIDGDDYWLLADPSRLTPITSKAWLLWLSIAFCVAVAGAAVIASRLSAPLKSLAKATSAIRRGRFDAPRLDESIRTTEIAEVNRGFNAMTVQLAQLEQDRIVMMAGLSHDLRTPLTRLRLEAEMSVSDAVAREGMASDIDQMDQIISKFLDYARPSGQPTSPVDISELIDVRVARTTAGNTAGGTQLVVNNTLPKPLWVMADPTDLGRVISNLLENAKRYGITPGSDPATAHIDIDLQKGAVDRLDLPVRIQIRDHGPGVAGADLPHLTTPFFRADASRSQVTGAGLGLAIVDKAIKQMGAQLRFLQAPGGGLVVELGFQEAAASDKA